jgi:hypothetical protein
MANYRKTDQEYIDDYDRYTIKRLKELEKDSKIPIYNTSNLKNTKYVISDDPISKYNILTVFYQTAVRLAQNKEESIRTSKYADEQKDRLIRQTPIPRNIKCEKCGSEMHHEGHLFKENDALLLFYFTCPNKHFPKKVVYPDGRREWVFKKNVCKKCGCEFDSKTEEEKDRLIFTDTCTGCGDVLTTELELPEPDLPIDEEERKKYCTDWKGRRTFEQDIQAIGDLMKFCEEQEKERKIREDYNVDKIEKINLPKLENSLVRLSEELGYIKFKFDSHSTENYLSVSFSAQDPTDREERESIKILTKAFKDFLLTTNWRLMTNGIDYRLGLLSGKLRAYVDDEGLLKIAKEIYENKKKA